MRISTYPSLILQVAPQILEGTRYALEDRMLFNSLAFFAFFPLVVTIYFTLNQRLSVLWLLMTSCLFYMWLIPNYIFILLATILVDYWGALLIARSDSSQKKRLFLILSVFFTCLILFAFKYFDFFQFNVAAVSSFLGWNYSPELWNIILPVGLSFHTFQSLSYVFEVYRGNQKPERDFPTYFLYVMFFPQLVAGPIERPQNLLHQFHEKHNFDTDRIISGLKLILLGLFKKVVIADRLALLVNPVFNDWQDAPSGLLALAVIFFAFQIYCDFSGYTTIARGAARVLGFELIENFNKPYVSTSVTEFWRRWHISLSTWFRDYLYIGLGGNRKRPYFNLLFTFAVSGLWHGANWTFIIWGTINGAAIALEKFLGIETKGAADRSFGARFFKTSFTFLIICFSWVFFRAASVQESIGILERIFSLETGTRTLSAFLFAHQVPIIHLYLGLLLISGLVLIERLTGLNAKLKSHPLTYAVILLAIISFGVFKQQQFIYFQF